MGSICMIFAIITLLLVLMTGQYNDTIMNIGIMFTNLRFEISFLCFSLIVFALGALCCSFLILSQFFDAHSRYNRLKKQYEKTSIGADEAEEKIKLLENKIKTLETALKNNIKGENNEG